MRAAGRHVRKTGLPRFQYGKPVVVLRGGGWQIRWPRFDTITQERVLVRQTGSKTHATREEAFRTAALLGGGR